MVLRGYHFGGYQRVTGNYNALPTLQEIREAHGWKRDYEKYLPLSRFIFRPLGFLLTWVAIRTGWTTESVACLSGIVGIVGCLCLMSKWPQLLPLGIGLLLLFNLLDCVDGSIARTTKTENPYGRFLDAVCGGIIDLAFWAVVGIMAYRHGDLLVWQNPFGYGAFFWLALGAATCFTSILVAFLERAYDRSLREAWEKISTSKQGVKGILLPILIIYMLAKSIHLGSSIII
jgi:phosphatidylglycerophosphate synthase